MKFNLKLIVCLMVIYIFHKCNSRCMNHYILLNGTIVNECDPIYKKAESYVSFDFNFEEVENIIAHTPTEIEDTTHKTVLEVQTFTNPTIQEMKATIEELEFEETSNPSLGNGILTLPTFEEIEDTSHPNLEDSETFTTITTEETEYISYPTFTEYEYDDTFKLTEASRTIVEIDLSHLNDNYETNDNTEKPEIDNIRVKFDMNELFSSFAKNTVELLLSPNNSKVNSTKNKTDNSSIVLTTVSAENNKTNNAETTEVLKDIAVVVACAAVGSLFVWYVASRLRSRVHQDNNLPEPHSADLTVDT